MTMPHNNHNKNTDEDDVQNVVTTPSTSMASESLPSSSMSRSTSTPPTSSYPAKDGTTKSSPTTSVPTTPAPPRHILPCLVFSQFAGTSLWFAGNAVISDMNDEFDMPATSLAVVTSAVQAGFIVGSLLTAVTLVADRYPPTVVFALACGLGAAVNVAAPLVSRGLWDFTMLRFSTGIALAGVYPVGMKVAADWFDASLGQALGWLVGALVVGTAFPFVLCNIPQPWEWLLWETSALAAVGGIVMVTCVPNGPHRRAATKLDPSVVWMLFKCPYFRSASLGYWGHMWELYAFWAYCPVVWEAYLERNESTWDPSLITFVVIAVGGLGCLGGGLLSERYGSGRIALAALVVSGTCCLLSPIMYFVPLPVVTLLFYLIWGTTVVMDSPQLSRLVAQTAPAQSRGTALTTVTAVGFLISIGSIQLLGVPLAPHWLLLLLAPGPMISIFSMRRFFLNPEGLSPDGEMAKPGTTAVPSVVQEQNNDLLSHDATTEEALESGTSPVKVLDSTHIEL